VTLTADGKTQQVLISPGSTVQDVLTKAQVSLDKLDQTVPDLTTVISNNNQGVKIIRVKETFTVEDVTIPFERQVVHNESLPVSQTILIQPGVNGSQEITYRHLFEDNVETSKNIVKTVTLKDAVPEITMVGVQTPFTAVPIIGRLVYLVAGNAWIMEESTGNRRPLISSGDLDGRVFSLSPNGDWLLFTRKPSKLSTDLTNSLWVVKTSGDVPQAINLNTQNIILFACWEPDQSQTINYSTGESRSTAPGWQANNDLKVVAFTTSGQVKPGKDIVSTNSGGIYGWWGTTFAWSPDGKQLAYARSDSVGLVDLTTGEFHPELNITPYQTHGDWAWVPAINWSPDNKILFTVSHAPGNGQFSDEESPFFDTSAIILDKGLVVNLAEQSGMFPAPLASPTMTSNGYQIAYLQAIFPNQSDTSRYRLVVMDRDGSNRQNIFPDESSPGVEINQVPFVWEPATTKIDAVTIAINYQGNLWLVDSITGKSQQVTGDGLVSRIDWK
jgi:resuscitation-promoting factor RpfB